jgi:hypothetical protein
MITSRSVGPIASEHQSLLADLAHQRDLLRLSLHGLTHEQAICTPTVSSLSLAGVIKRAANTERRWIVGVVGPRAAAGPGYRDRLHLQAGFELAAGETLADVIGFYTAVAQETAAIVAGIADLGEMLPVPGDLLSLRPASDPHRWPVRSIVRHIIEETASHARAADIIRGILDRRAGRDAAPMTAHGASGR